VQLGCGTVRYLFCGFVSSLCREHAAVQVGEFAVRLAMSMRLG
jgi:hypothetical protein